MTDYLEIENSLISGISDKNLRDSLIQIRKSAEAIWSIEAPRIIQGFTDHGFDHSLRLIKYVSQLLNANKGDVLSDEEMYLLIAGIYLHDIGMQCDVCKFPKIKEKAIKFGAVFNIEFTSTNANQYSIQEQIEIRNNHHFLSAAWIDFAFHSPETTLGKSIQSVPDEILSDLIDICKYHSKLDISECSLQFEIHTKGRKQLIAALVRFADELDVEKSRVSIETVMTFSLEPENAYYWWLHYLTTVEINDNILILKVRLNPQDYSLYSSFVKENYLESFRKKNKPVLDILNSKSIPISISSNSEVVAYEYAKKLPPEIVKVIEGMKSEVAVDKTTSTTETKRLLNNQLKYFPNPKPYFAGREAELKELKDTFEISPFIFIEGGGGIGKTQFVAKFIEDLGINDRIVWYECIPTSQPDDIIKGAGFEELLKGKEKTEREKFSAFKDKIEEYNLVVFIDNYQEVETVPAFKALLAFINDYLKTGHIIVLGRDNIITPQLQPKRIPLKGLGDDSFVHARKLIKHSYPDLIHTPTETLKTLCDTLKGYPLAVDLAIYLLSLNVPIEKILNVAVTKAQSEGSEIELISNRLLNEIFKRTDASEDEREFLRLFSIFRGKILDTEAMSVIPQKIFENGSQKLFNRNLLEFNNGYFELHPLIREFCYDKLANKKEIHHKAAKYYIGNRTNQWNPELEEKIFYHLSCSEQWQDISDTIIQLGREFILHGFLDRLQQMVTLVKQQGILDPVFDIYEGDIAEIKGDWDMALSIFNKAKQSTNLDVKIEGMIKYGEMLYRKGMIKEAQSYFEDAIIITDDDTHKKPHARALNDLGIVCDFFGKMKEALNFHTASLQIRQVLHDPEDIATSFGNIGNIKSDLGLIKEALEFYEKSLKISEEIGDKSGIANSLNNIGNIKSDLGLIKEALEFYEKSMKIEEEIGYKSGIANSLNNIGSIKSDLGLNIEALEQCEKSLKIQEEIGYKSGIAGSLNSIGIIKSALGLKKEALEFYEKSLKISEEIGKKSGIAGSLNNIGSIKSVLGLKKEALEFYEKSLKIQEEIGYKLGIAGSLNNIGSIKSALGLKKEALEFYEKSLKISEEIGNKSTIANELNNIGVILFKNRHELEKACFYLLKSLGLYEQMGMPDKKNPKEQLFQMRQKLGLLKFEKMVKDALQQLDEDLRNFIILNEILGRPVIVEKHPGRNDPCNCGSGKKYKNCHGKPN
jgi:tetratricopeptide (TPR) repeat protein